MFERVGRYGEPALLNEHFDGTGWANPIRCGPAVHPVAATLSGLVLQVCVYVVGLNRCCAEGEDCGADEP
jgi:hypothetical protein